MGGGGEGGGGGKNVNGERLEGDVTESAELFSSAVSVNVVIEHVKRNII